MAQKEDLKFEIGFPKLIQLTFFCSFSKNCFRYIMLNWLSSFQPSFKTLPRKFRLILDMFSKFSSSYIIVLRVLTPPQKQPILFRYKCHPSIFYRLLEGRVREKDWENEDISGEKERKTTKHPEKSNGQLSMNSLSSLFPPFLPLRLSVSRLWWEVERKDLLLLSLPLSSSKPTVHTNVRTPLPSTADRFARLDWDQSSLSVCLFVSLVLFFGRRRRQKSQEKTFPLP